MAQTDLAESSRESRAPASYAAEATGRLNEKTAIVTGARRSIGRAIAVALAAQGARVVVHYLSHSDEADATVDALRSSGADAIAVGGDLSHSSAVAALFDQTRTQFGGVDIVVANAGATAAPTPVAAISDELFESLLNTNTRATFYVLREAARTVRDGGRIINISSSSVRSTPAGFAAYATTKSGALTTVEILARELGPRGITANSIMAGAIGSGFLDPSGDYLKNLPKEMVTTFMNTVATETPAGRIGQPSDIAPIAAFLASPEAGWINGQTILANNGATV